MPGSRALSRLYVTVGEVNGRSGTHAARRILLSSSQQRKMTTSHSAPLYSSSNNSSSGSSNNNSSSRCNPGIMASISSFASTDPRRSFSWSRQHAQVETASVVDNRNVLVQWDDGHSSLYNFTWLRVNCPSFVHESGQITVFAGDVDPELRPREVRTEQAKFQIEDEMLLHWYWV